MEINAPLVPVNTSAEILWYFFVDPFCGTRIEINTSLALRTSAKTAGMCCNSLLINYDEVLKVFSP